MNDIGNMDFKDLESQSTASEMGKEAYCEAMQEGISSLSPNARKLSEFKNYAFDREMKDIINFRKTPVDLDADIVRKAWNELTALSKEITEDFIRENMVIISLYLSEDLLNDSRDTDTYEMPVFSPGISDDTYSMEEIEIGCKECNMLLPGHSITTESLTLSTVHHVLMHHIEELMKIAPGLHGLSFQKAHEICKDSNIISQVGVEKPDNSLYAFQTEFQGVINDPVLCTAEEIPTLEQQFIDDSGGEWKSIEDYRENVDVRDPDNRYYVWQVKLPEALRKKEVSL